MLWCWITQCTNAGSGSWKFNGTAATVTHSTENRSFGRTKLQDKEVYINDLTAFLHAYQILNEKFWTFVDNYTDKSLYILDMYQQMWGIVCECSK